MAPLVVPNAWHLQAFFVDADSQWSNVFAADVGLIPVLTQPNADAVGGAYEDAWDANLKSQMAATVSLDRVVVTDLREEGAPQFVHTVGVAGTSGGDQMPDQNAVCLTLRTAHRSKAGRGRMYFSGMAEPANAANGVIAPGVVTAVEDFGADLLAAMAALSWDLGVISRKDPAPGSTGTIRPVVSVEVIGNRWRSQDRRARAA